jgi:hypothetical protein
MTASFSEMQDSLAHASLRDLIVLIGSGVNGRTFNELAAVRERLLDLAFRDLNVQFQDRSLAAVWSRALDSLIMLMLENRIETSAAYVSARNKSMDEVLNFGFGSVGQLAELDPAAILKRLTTPDGEDEQIDRIRYLRSHLAATAFGTHEETPPHSAA